jgi:hypothetical protein
MFDGIILLAGERVLYEGPEGLALAEYFAEQGLPCIPGYNVADHLLDLANASPAPRVSASLTKEAGAITDIAAN